MGAVVLRICCVSFFLWVGTSFLENKNISKIYSVLVTPASGVRAKNGSIFFLRNENQNLFRVNSAASLENGNVIKSLQIY